MKLSALVRPALACGTILLFSLQAHAAFVSNTAGTAYYDTDLDITWLQDANYSFTSGFDADGRMNWPASVAWVDGLTFEGVNDWRLASQGEMQYHYSVNGISIASPGVFSNIGPNSGTHYWSSTESSATNAVQVRFTDGASFSASKNSKLGYQWAVADGDVFNAAVPVPAAAWMFVSALAGLSVLRRNRD